MFDDKLTHARRLIEQRDQIDQELRVLFGELPQQKRARRRAEKNNGTTSSKTALPHQTRKSDPHVCPVPAEAGMNKRARIIELNDQLRTTFKGG